MGVNGAVNFLFILNWNNYLSAPIGIKILQVENFCGQKRVLGATP